MTSLLDAPPESPPRFLHLPESVSSAGQEAIELAEVAGLILDPWQRLVLDGALRESSPGAWAAFEVAVIIPRQNGKGSILEALELAHMFLFGSELILHTAHLDKTAKNHFQRMVRLIDGCPELSRKAKPPRYSNGDRGIATKAGGQIMFTTRAKEGGRGLSGDLVVIDEAMRLKGLGDLLPTLSARPNPQIWYTSSAPLVGPESDVLRGICDRGRKGAKRMAYFEWSTPHDVDPDDRSAWWAANPAMGHRLSIDVTETERASMTDDEFKRERLGAWNPEESLPPFIPTNLWNACEDIAARPSDPVVIGVEMTLDRLAATIAVAGSFDGHPMVELAGDHRGPDTSQWVITSCISLWEKHHPRFVAVDKKSPMAPLIPELRRAGVEVKEYDFGDMIAACSGFFDDVMTGTLRHNGDQVLAGAVAGAKKRDAGGAWLWDRKPGQVITPLVAVTLARHGHLEQDAPVSLADNFY